MTDSQQRAQYYRKMFARLDEIDARRLIDRLQVLALTRPDTVQELETFLDRDEARNAPLSNEVTETSASPSSGS
jgi:hypothetical protein